jgi:transcriptional regulator with XRE-family HTH domain
MTMRKIRFKLCAARIQEKMWTVEEAAREIGVDAQTYRRWEQGEQTPRLGSLRQLCSVYGKTARELGF